MHILVVGQGKLAASIKEVCEEMNVETTDFPDTPRLYKIEETVCLHVGSGRQLEESLKFCQMPGIPFVLASTGHSDQIPEYPGTPVIDGPNLSLPIIGVLAALQRLKKEWDDLGLSVEGNIMETHQASKQSTPGTAKRIADLMGLSQDSIHSVRDPADSKALGVPEEHLERHGWHFVTLNVGGVRVELNTKINGGRPYGIGAIELARLILSTNPDPGIYRVEDLITDER